MCQKGTFQHLRGCELYRFLRLHLQCLLFSMDNTLLKESKYFTSIRLFPFVFLNMTCCWASQKEPAASTVRTIRTLKPQLLAIPQYSSLSLSQHEMICFAYSNGRAAFDDYCLTEILFFLQKGIFRHCKGIYLKKYF